MKKIAIAGAGVGGLVCAYYLAQQQYDVVVYEAQNPQTVTYPWHDDIEVAALQAIGLGMPPAEIYYDKRNWTFCPPMSNVKLYAGLAEPTDISVSRRGLWQWLADLAQQAGAQLVFDTPVALWVQNGAVKGLLVDGEPQEFALVVDNCGVDSPLRAALSAESGIQLQARQDEVFCAYRAFYNRNEGITVADDQTNRVYLLHDGGKGISWCIADPTRPTVDVLIGRLGLLDDSEITHLLGLLRQDNPILGETLQEGGAVCRIPVRHPALCFAVDGYALLGDSAFMTIPMLGSGLVASMTAGKLLAQTVAEHQSVSRQALWHYQVEYYRQIGAEHCGADIMKRWLLGADPEDVRWLFESGVLSEKDINEGAAGRNIRLARSELLEKARKGYKRLGLLLQLSSLLSKCNKAVKTARNIPVVWNEDAIAGWQSKMQKLYQ